MHGVQHVVEQIMKAADDWDDVRRGLSALAHLFGMGTYFLRFVLTVQRVVSVQDGGLFWIVNGDSPPEAIERPQLLRKYFTPPEDQRKYDKKKAKAKAKAKTKQPSKRQAAATAEYKEMCSEHETFQWRPDRAFHYSLLQGPAGPMSMLKHRRH